MPTEYRKNILVVRLSALGDVAILQPIVKGRALANPDVLFTVAAPPLLEPLFQGVPNIHFVATPKRQPIYALYQQLAKTQPTIVADMHWVNRVIGVDLLFLAHGTPVYHIHKERLKQKRLVRRWCKTNTIVTPSWQRYEKVFDKCGIAPAQYPTHYIQEKKHLVTDIKRRIGIAPFAQHAGKIMPHSQTRQLISLLSQHSEYEILLFGGKEEATLLETWAAEHANVQSTSGKQSFAEELQLIASLDVMISMDSANMHFASCMEVPVVSIWGATDAICGFYGWRQDPQHAIATNHKCRPCSIYGNKPCKYGDYRCLTDIDVADIAEHIFTMLKANPME